MTPADVIATAHLADIAELIADRDGTRDPDAYRRLASTLRRAVRSGQPIGSPLLTRDYLDMDEAARLARVSVRTLRRHGVPSVRVGARRLVATEDLTAWLRDRKTNHA